MNAGYISLLLILVTGILFASGWKDVLIRGITPGSLLLFFMGWFLSCFWSFPVGGIQVNGCVLQLGMISLIGGLRASGFLLKLHLLSVGLLLASITFFVREMLPLMPALILGEPEWTPALVVGLLGAVMVRYAPLQLSILTGGLLLGEAMFVYAHRDLPGANLGGTAFQDLWWLAIYSARCSSLVMESAAAGVRQAVRCMAVKLRGTREQKEE